MAFGFNYLHLVPVAEHVIFSYTLVQFGEILKCNNLFNYEIIVFIIISLLFFQFRIEEKLIFASIRCYSSQKTGTGT